VCSNRDVTHEIKLALLHLKDQLLAVIAFSCSGVLILLLGLVLLRVRALIHIMSGLSTVVANVGWEFLRLWNLLMILPVLEIFRRLVLGRGHSPLPRWRGLWRPMSMLLDKVELLARSTSSGEISLSLPIFLCLPHGVLLRDSFVY
jgi:hypothetical protein